MPGHIVEEISAGADETQCDFVLGSAVNCHIPSEHLDENAEQ